MNIFCLPTERSQHREPKDCMSEKHLFHEGLCIGHVYHNAIRRKLGLIVARPEPRSTDGQAWASEYVISPYLDGGKPLMSEREPNEIGGLFWPTLRLASRS